MPMLGGKNVERNSGGRDEQVPSVGDAADVE